MEKRIGIYLISLGCAKNLVDGEHMLGFANSRGYMIARSLDEADIAVVNTCGFKRDSVEEAIEMILEVVEQKKMGILQRLIVTGCMVQRYGYKLRRLIPEVDGWLGTGEIYRLGDLLDEQNISRG